MNDNSKFFDEEFKENAKDTVDKVDETVKENKNLIAVGFAAVIGLIVGNRLGKKHSKKANKIIIETAKQQARSEYAEELLKEAVRSSLNN